MRRRQKNARRATHGPWYACRGFVPVRTGAAQTLLVTPSVPAPARRQHQSQPHHSMRAQHGKPSGDVGAQGERTGVLTRWRRHTCAHKEDAVGRDAGPSRRESRHSFLPEGPKHEARGRPVLVYRAVLEGVEEGRVAEHTTLIEEIKS